MRLTFRAKLMAIVGLAAFAFVLLIFASGVLARSVDRQLATIQERYLPKVALQPKLDGALERLRRGFQDAVAAHDADALAGTRPLKNHFLVELASAQSAILPADSEALRVALEDYDATAFDVSRRLIADETGEALVDEMGRMQAKQTRVNDALEKATAFDGKELSEAFAAAARSEAVAQTYRLWIGLACLALVLVLSIGLGRSLLRSVAELTAGFERFGASHFEEPIRVASGDELGDLAEHANQMASRLERSTRERKRFETELQVSNHELEAFSYSVAHDLRAPLRGINGLSRALLEDASDRLDDDGKDYLQRIAAGSLRMGLLIDALLTLSRVSRVELQRETVNLTRLADGVMSSLRASQPERTVEFVNQENVVSHGDATLLRALLDNLLGNAWKFTGGRPDARITFGSERKDGAVVYTVSDNGAGFDMAYADKLFAPFQRLHKVSEFAGTGIGLATVQRIVRRHGGDIWAEGAVGRGATFYFTLSSNPGGTSQ
jgi:signal transduction histidine kinase